MTPLATLVVRLGVQADALLLAMRDEAHRTIDPEQAALLRAGHAAVQREVAAVDRSAPERVELAIRSLAWRHAVLTGAGADAGDPSVERWLAASVDWTHFVSDVRVGSP